MAKKIGPLTMRHWGDPILREACRPVDVITPELRQLVIDMVETMYNANGVGLAAPQVGRLESLCIIDIPEDSEKEECQPLNASIPMPLVMFNPEILAMEGEQTDEEGCLSFPSIHTPITRANKVSFTFNDINGDRKTYTAYGLLARAVQHELDHLHGRVFIDHLADQAPLSPKLQKLEKKTRKALGLAVE